MAFVNNAKDSENTLGMNSQKPEEENKEQAQTVGGTTGAPISSGSQTSSAPTGSSTPKSTPTSGKASFQQYQQANQGGATNKLTDSTTSNVANQVQAAKTGINKATQEFNQKAATGGLANSGTAIDDVKNVVQSARQTAEPVSEQNKYGNAITQDQASRFQDVINAKYEGPSSLNQTSNYQNTLDAANKAGSSVDQSKTAQGREELLRNIYSQGGNYNQGLNKLDAGLLNASQAGVSRLQDTAKQAGNIQNQLEQAQLGATTAAQNLTRENINIRNQARDIFNTEQAAEREATENRLDQIRDNWNSLPEYYKNILNQQGRQALTQQELDFLGLDNNTRTFNAGSNLIRANAFDRDSQISKTEQARQAVLAQLAGLDASGILDANLRYADAEKAGTQTALDAINREATRDAFDRNTEEVIRDLRNINHTGTGSFRDDEYSRGSEKSSSVLDAVNKLGDDRDATVDSLNQVLAGGLYGGWDKVTPIWKNSGKFFQSLQNNADRIAYQDLANKIASAANNAGYNNRLVADETGMDDTRRNALNELLKNLGVK